MTESPIVDEQNALSFKENYKGTEALKTKTSKKSNKISKGTRITIYILFSIINIIVNMDSGNIPPAIDQVKKDLKTFDPQIGAFPSLVSTGTFIGGMISFSIIDRVSKKWMLIIANSGIVACLFTFPIELLSHISILFINRILVGMFMVSLIFICYSHIIKYSSQFG